MTGKLLALNPVNFPDAWFLNALGNYYLENFKEAEKSARQGMKVDDQHQRSPGWNICSASFRSRTQNYSEAAAHVQNYLKTATQPSEIADAQKQLAEINRLSASVSDPAPQKK